jgi:hypothetical protein
MKTTKIFLEFQQVEFNNAKALFDKKQMVKKQMYAELSELINGAVEPSESIENDPLQYFYDWLLIEYKDRNQMNLKAVKLVDLLEIDLTKFKDSIAKNNAIPNIPEPIEEDFKVYAETPEELARLKLSTDFVEVIKRTKKVVGFVNLSNFRAIIQFDGLLNEYVINKDFVKSKHYKNVLEA